MARYLNPQTCKRKSLCWTSNALLFICMGHFHMFPSKRDPHPCSGAWASSRPCSTLCPDACCEFAFSCYQQVLSNQLFCFTKCDFAFWEHREDLGVIQRGTQHGAFGLTKVSLLWGLLLGSWERNGWTQMQCNTWRHQATFTRKNSFEPSATVRRCCAVEAEVSQ